MMFFTGMHHPHNAGKVQAAFLSVNAIRRRRSSFPVRRCVLDCAGFTELHQYGGYRHPPEEYASEIRKVRGWIGRRLIGAVAQDFMCEAFMLAKTGGTIDSHQRQTIERYRALLDCDLAGVRVIPVLQGYTPESYADHARAYGDLLRPRAWVGVGSVCKRNARPRVIEDVLLAIKRVRPDLRLHGFGVKITALESQLVRDLLFSADSMAWSFAARWEGRDGNDPAEAAAYGRRVATMKTQLYLPGIAA
jgi:hypothetical protein